MTVVIVIVVVIRGGVLLKGAVPRKMPKSSTAAPSRWGLLAHGLLNGRDLQDCRADLTTSRPQLDFDLWVVDLQAAILSKKLPWSWCSQNFIIIIINYRQLAGSSVRDKLSGYKCWPTCNERKLSGPTNISGDGFLKKAQTKIIAYVCEST